MRPGRCRTRDPGGAAGQQAWRSVAAWASSRLVRQRSRSQRFRRADGRGTRRGMVFTDPPYNVPIEGHASGLGTIHHRPFPMASGEMDQAEFTAFLRQACRNLTAFSAAGSLHLHLHGLAPSRRTARRRPEVYGEFKNLCVWVKDNAGMGSLYRSQHELVLVFKQRGGRAPQQCPARPVWAQPQQCVALSRGQFLCPLWRGG